MRSIWITNCLVLTSTAGFSPDNKDGSFGWPSDRAARLFGNAPIETRNADTGANFQTDSGGPALYKLNALPPGTYELSISSTGLRRFVQQSHG